MLSDILLSSIFLLSLSLSYPSPLFVFFFSPLLLLPFGGKDSFLHTHQLVWPLGYFDGPVESEQSIGEVRVTRHSLPTRVYSIGAASSYLDVFADLLSFASVVVVILITLGEKEKKWLTSSWWMAASELPIIPTTIYLLWAWTTVSSVKESPGKSGTTGA